MKRLHILAACCLVVIIGGAAGAGELRFNRALSDNAVLQREKPVTIRGFADKGAEVTVTFDKQTKKARADANGEWSVVLDAMPSSGKGQELRCQVSGVREQVVLKNVVVGDVILFARQTSIDVSLGRDKKGQEAAAALSANPLFRVLSIKTIPAVTPQTDLAPEATAGWGAVDKTAALSMSASAYYLGRDLAEEVDVPVGIIDLNMGKNFTLGWIDSEAIAANDDYYGYKTRITGYATGLTDDLAKFKAQAGQEKPEKAKGWVDSDPLAHPLYPASGYNAVLHPLRDLSVKAALVQLGNDYAYLAYEKVKEDGHLFEREKLDPAWWTTYLYRKRAYRAAFEVLPRVPSLWRKYLGDKQLSLAFVMPPSSPVGSYAMHHHEIREVQRQTAVANAGVGLILPGVEHIPFSGQPADDKLVAERGLAWVLGSVYGQTEKASCGPLFERVDMNFNKAQIHFKDGTASGLEASGKAMDMFEAAAIDAEWFPAKAKIDGDTIRLESDDVNQIAYVRYNYKKVPDYGLTNGDGLPAIPFRTGEHKWIDVPRNKEASLPPEYTTPASEWQNEGVAIISGGGAKYGIGSGWLGPIGVKVTPFGPNMKVVQLLAGSPADGKLAVGDLIYRVNGELLGESHLHQVAAAVEHAETEEGAGKIVLSFRREEKLHDVKIEIEVLGTRSSTSPYACPKTERIISNFEKFLAERGGLSTGAAGGGWLKSDLLFLLGTGNPEYQGLVRRFVYGMIAKNEEKEIGPGGWNGGHGALLMGEYYLATGDRNVLPTLRKYCRGLEETQCRPGSFPQLFDTSPAARQMGGWRHNHPGGQGYGMMPALGLPAMIGWRLSIESGVEVDPEQYAMGVRFFKDHQAEMGYNSYAAAPGKVLAPERMDPEKMAKGMISGHNGSRGLAAMLFNLLGDTRITNLNSLYCSYAFNECNIGHGGPFHNAIWTPLGANLQSKPAFIEFMKNHRWFMDLKRMYNHGYEPAVGQTLSLLAPRKRLRIMGAAPSVFAKDAPAVLKPALDAYYAKDYEKATRIADEMVASGELVSDDRTKAEQLSRAAKELLKSIAYDMDKVEALIKEGKTYEASLDLAQLKGVLPAEDKRLGIIDGMLSAEDAQKAIGEDKRRYDELQKSLAFSTRAPRGSTASNEGWQSLTTEELASGRMKTLGTVKNGTATLWRAKVVEAPSQAPEDWIEPDFDDSQWNKGMLPFSWHLNHSLIARADFEVKDRKAIEALRISTHPFRQQSIVVYINGKMVAKFNQCEANTGWVHGELKDKALKHLRNGKNTIAFRTTNDWRWATRSTPANGGFGLKLEAKIEGEDG